MSKLTNLRYDGYSTGRYGCHNSHGITLQFIDQLDGTTYYAIWNVDLQRKRRTKNCRRGSDYPNKKFSVTRRMKFFCFWHYTCCLPLPSRGLTTFHECMGKLRKFRFEAHICKGRRLSKDTIKPVITDKNLISSSQSTDRKLIDLSDKDFSADQRVPVFTSLMNTCKNNYGKSNQGKLETSVSPLDEDNASVEDWISEYDKYYEIFHKQDKDWF